MLGKDFRCTACQCVTSVTYSDREEFLASDRPACESCGSKRTVPFVDTSGCGEVHLQGGNAKASFDNMYPRVSFTLPRWMKGCEHTRDGKPIVRDKAHERNIMAGAYNNETYRRD